MRMENVVNKSSYVPTRGSVFTETVQIGIVVRDLDATLRRYVDDYGIGPWEIHEFDSRSAKDLREHGQPVERAWRLAVTMVGGVMWELIEPLDDESVYARFLVEKGEGVHHIAVATPSFDDAVAEQAKRETSWCSAASSAASRWHTFRLIASWGRSSRSSAGRRPRNRSRTRFRDQGTEIKNRKIHT